MGIMKTKMSDLGSLSMATIGVDEKIEVTCPGFTFEKRVR